MKKVIFGIFAHPDDEAFGPAGTLVMEKAQGSEVHLVCATAGENGTNLDDTPNLAEIRLGEWRAAGDLIGADSMHHLGFVDGNLSNNDYFDLADRIKAIVANVTTGRDDIEIEFMSLDLNGLTGHLDHICMARVACYVHRTLKQSDNRVTRLRLACLTREDIPEVDCHWLYMEAGRTVDEIDETIDASVHLETIQQIMRAHHSQRQDCETILAHLGDRIAINHFLVLN